MVYSKILLIPKSYFIINTQIFSLENQFLYYTVAFQSDIDPHLFIPTDNNWSFFLYAVLRSCCAPIWFRFKGPNFDGFLIYWFWFISWSVWISAVICSILFHHVMLVVINNYYKFVAFSSNTEQVCLHIRMDDFRVDWLLHLMADNQRFVRCFSLKRTKLEFFQTYFNF